MSKKGGGKTDAGITKGEGPTHLKRNSNAFGISGPNRRKTLLEKTKCSSAGLNDLSGVHQNGRGGGSIT